MLQGMVAGWLSRQALVSISKVTQL